MVYGLAISHVKNKFDADDVYQEVFLRLVSNIHKLNSQEHVKAWLIKVTINCCKNHYRLWKANTVEDTTVYWAQFIHNGIGYYIESKNLSQEEFVKTIYYFLL